LDELAYLQVLIGRALILITAPAVTIAIFLGLVLSLRAYSDEAGHAFQSEAGHPFRNEAGQGSDLKPAT
jgi:hypothetical protein